MVLPIDAGSWDADQLLGEIAVRLPKGWNFDTGQAENDFWHATLLNEKKEPVRVDVEATQQLALLNLLGWLEMQATPANPNSPWAPRKAEVDHDLRAHDQAYRVRVEEDPPDLDPKEIAAVYSSARKPR
jgi:hypothetical protein